MNKTYSIKAGDISKPWLLIDAKDLVLGRLASEIAKILRGKHKPTFTPHMDCGDNVVVINAKDIKLTGNKAARKDGKIYYWHTGHPGGIKETTAGKLLEGKYPERVLELAVKRMISKNTLRNRQMSNLHIYAGSEHPHSAQKPEVYDFGSKNPKNKR
ncbi:50S ribosomal protein L13 [Candidatus Phycorickettsia trachydisci]|uniref:Large ribosomal subunit protein uL13 n=1 Tax=Candidatus Phycorickettsia trachydisci TaxID=2115978 RepID=A0A2P1PA12_9RICK|nr:50S ribosomal protein L13 [Candidatus Phycorickettsia trachydisci]AVP88107.1 50S ribosomal protein L13 [Candidatus Phycorickettsia trachydisci]